MNKNKRKTVAFHTLGCKVNEYESSRLSRELASYGWITVSFSDPADVYVVNTCSVTRIADHKSRQMLNRAFSQAQKTGALTVAMGCYASLEKSHISADLIIDNKDRDRAAAIIEEAYEQGQEASDNAPFNEPALPDRAPEDAQDNEPAQTDRAPEGSQDNGPAQTDRAPEGSQDNGPAQTDRAPEGSQDNGPAQTDRAPEGSQDNGPAQQGGAIVAGRVGAFKDTPSVRADGDTRKIPCPEQKCRRSHNPDHPWPRKRTRAFIKVEDGCDSFCSYCIIPYARGPVRSVRPDDILSEVMECADSGIREIVITGINVNRYGTGLVTKPPAYTGEPLAELLARIASESGISRIRLSSVEPGLINKDFVSRIAEIKSICPHFHMSLQSGSGSVLKRMNRRYTPDEYMKSVELLRQYYDDPALTTDVIVGFPGETEEEHRESLEFIRTAGLYRLNVFRFSGRPGTPAFSMEGQVRNAVKEERAHEMLTLGESLNAAYEERHRGRTLEVLLEESEEDGSVTGYSREYIRVSVPEGVPGELVEISY